MADYIINFDDVKRGSVSGVVLNGKAGEDVLAGQAVYLKVGDGKLWLSDCDAGVAQAASVGIALTSGKVDQVIAYLASGTMDVGAAVFPAAGMVVVLSDTAGALRPPADSGAGDYLTIMGWSSSTSQMVVNVLATGYVQ
jgi:hypothetical protein